ncbi:MAG: SDR family NAD(P)-dependent oxidoreductase [Dongiaceae bacterium]
MTQRLQGKTAIVIGAARGIGAGIAELFVEQGARVVIGDVIEAEGAATAARLGERGEAMFRRVDVSSQADNRALVAAALERFGRVDILVQNAGIYPLTMIADISPDEWDRVLAVNLKGPFLALQACLPPMRAQRYGRVVFISSITGPRVSAPGHGHYSASKAGIVGFIRAAALEAAPFGITVNGIEPGNILTEGITQNRTPEFIRAMEQSVPLGRLGTPRDIAWACLFLASDEASYVTGTTLIVDGGQILPEAKV